MVPRVHEGELQMSYEAMIQYSGGLNNGCPSETYFINTGHYNNDIGAFFDACKRFALQANTIVTVSILKS